MYAPPSGLMSDGNSVLNCFIQAIKTAFSELRCFIDTGEQP